MASSTRAVATLVALGMTASNAAALPAEFERGLRENSTIYVATRRADGSRSSAAPVWFWWDGQVLYSTTAPGSHKARRLRRGSPVYVSVNGENGPFIAGVAEIITDLDVVAHMGEQYNQKYWIAWAGFFRPRVDRVREGKTLAYKVTFPTP
ncbi:MAG TPA: pyridoxamine 5'-phosphate oxidase family protein [Terriglobales bacterium]|nr:pyridoxamine 5'-phosphate oxidase family protein [Terriglobales bacterium]